MDPFLIEGNLDEIMMYNASPFSKKEFAKFLSNQVVNYLPYSPHDPHSNRFMKRLVQTIKYTKYTGSYVKSICHWSKAQRVIIIDEECFLLVH